MLYLRQWGRVLLGILLPFGVSASPQVMDGVNVDVCLLNPASHDYVLNSRHEDLIDVAHHLGINLFRLTDGGCAHGKADRHAWTAVLKKMQAEGISAIVTTEPPMNGENMTQDSLTFITSIVTDNKIGTYSNVYGVDVINEPVLDDNNISLIRQAIHQIKAVYPDLRVSVGGWRTKPGMGACPSTFKGQYCWNKAEDGKAFAGMLDYYSAHIYGYDKPMNGPYPDAFVHTTHFLDTILPFAEGKPVIIEEYGAANGVAVTDQEGLGSPELQANVTDGVLRAVRAYRDKNITGSTQWAFYNRSDQTGTPGWDMVFNGGDTIAPAAYVLQKYSTGTSDAPVNIPMPVTAKARILHNTDNGATITLRPGDIVGFLLHLDPSRNYVMTLDDPVPFTETELFTYKKTRDYYTATLHARVAGTTGVKITQNPCTADCQSFHVKLKVLPGS